MKDDLELENQALTALTMNNLVPLSNTGGANNLANRHHSSTQGANNATGQGILFYAKYLTQIMTSNLKISEHGCLIMWIEMSPPQWYGLV